MSDRPAPQYVLTNTRFGTFSGASQSEATFRRAFTHDELNECSVPSTITTSGPGPHFDYGDGLARYWITIEKITQSGDEVKGSGVSPILQFFDYTHLPERLQAVSRPFHTLAYQMERELSVNAEKSMALRKLLEARDTAVRALLFKEPSG